MNRRERILATEALTALADTDDQFITDEILRQAVRVCGFDKVDPHWLRVLKGKLKHYNATTGEWDGRCVTGKRKD